MGSASLPNPEQWGTWLVQFKGNHHVIGHKAPVVVVRFNQFLYSKKDDQGVVRRNQVRSSRLPTPGRGYGSVRVRVGSGLTLTLTLTQP